MAFRRFFDGEDKTGPELAEVFAMRLNDALKKNSIDDSIQLVIEKHPRPGNVDKRGLDQCTGGYDHFCITLYQIGVYE